MVELCELKLMHHDMEWPPDMDQHIANLAFERSTLDEQSLFSSMNVDPSLISTDSLDMEQLRARCETNKNDYKLTFEDSGQWTQSGLFSSPSKNTTGTSGSTNSNNVMTTWGRLRDPNEDDRSGGCDKVYGEKTSSMPTLTTQQRDVTLSPCGGITINQQQRPTSLLANFVERSDKGSQSKSDFDYHQPLFMGPGRFFDVNDNEVTFNGTKHNGTIIDNGNDRWQNRQIINSGNGARISNVIAPSKPKRTFADLSSKNETSICKDSIAPELKFLALHHEVPNFCQTSISFGEILKKAKAGILYDCEDKLEYSDLNIYDNKKTPDSGLGTSTGPTHIEDWPSLAVLLPKHVVDACSFFKSNTSLLTGSPSSSNSSGLNCQQNNIEAKKVQRIGSHMNEGNPLFVGSKLRLHPHQWSKCFKNCNIICECKDINTTSEYILDENMINKEKKLMASTHKMKLHAHEISIIGLPIYDIKRKLVENVVEGVAEIVRNNSKELLCKAIIDLLNDGIENGNDVWRIITKLTASGRATNKIYDVMIELNNSPRSIESKVKDFVCALISLRSLDGWLSYIVLKDNVLTKLYNNNAFLVKANTAYRSLFWRLIESVEWLSVIDAKQESRKFSTSFCSDSFINKTGPSKLPSDSRVPKSSSVPSRLIVENIEIIEEKNKEEDNNFDNASMTATHVIRTNEENDGSTILKRTRIPILLPRPRRTLSCAAKMISDHNMDNYGTIYNNQQTAYVLEDVNEDGMLPVFNGERVRVLSTRGMFSRCCLIRPAHGRIMNGIVLTRNLNLC
ncbi:RUN domain-containing protein [Strongyloides ratti]|uniref:RUN domain-containing protein n=1 Tax=Strongyloides ratti TaxID=34506 RepID=A0A090L414_STRRB|nr:RUN domain-containing protein [Strongyloides ratti]CEF64467.1 RUN domain-containing protein [Strongyloides ratti]